MTCAVATREGELDLVLPSVSMLATPTTPSGRMSQPSSSRPPLLGLLNPNSRHYHQPSGGGPSSSFRLDPVTPTQRATAAHHSTSSDEDDDGPPRSLLLDTTPRQSVLLPRDRRSPLGSGRGGDVEAVEPFINPSSKGSTSSSSSSSSDSDSSGSNSETTRSPPPPKPAQPLSLPLPVTTPVPSSSSSASPRAGQTSTSDIKGKGKEKDTGESNHRRRKRKSSSSSGAGKGARGFKAKGGLDAYEKALWDWVNVDDLDAFLQDVSPPSNKRSLLCLG